MDGKYPVMELFGPTIQGEGGMTGVPSHFLRFGGCSLRCEWCDSMDAVLPDQVHLNGKRQTIQEILRDVKQLPTCNWITLTGGDPCIHQGLETLIYGLNTLGLHTAVETQGMLFPSWLDCVDLITFSPKGPSSGNQVDYEDMLHWIMHNKNKPDYLKVIIKVVIADSEDLDYAWGLYTHVRRNPHEYYIREFWFTAVSPTEEFVTEVQDETNENVEPDMEVSRDIIKIGGVLHNYRWLANEIINKSSERDDHTPADIIRVGCQQHVLLWPDKTVGV